MYRVFTLFVYNTQQKTPNRRNFCMQRGHVIMAVPDAAFLAVRFRIYTARRT